MDRKGLGSRIKAARKERGLTGEKLAECCNINATYLRQIEAGTKTPSLPMFVGLCRQLSVSPSYLARCPRSTSLTVTTVVLLQRS